MAFNEKLEKKLKKILAKAGLEEDKANNIVEEVEEALAEEDVQEDVNPGEDTPLPPQEEPNGEGEPAPQEPAPEEPAPEGEPAPQVEEEVPPADGSIEQALDELAAQEGAAPQVEEPAPIAPDQPPVPQADPTEIAKLQNDLGEANKTIEGLVARVQSLEEALKAAGVITSDAQVGDENPRITPNASRDSGEDVLDDVLRTINGK